MSTSPDDWNQSDELILKLFSPFNPFDRGFEGLEPVLKVIESLDPELRLDKLYLNRRLKYSRQTLHKRFHETDNAGGVRSLMLVRSKLPEGRLSLTGWGQDIGPHFFVTLHLRPFAFFRESGQAEKRAGHLLSLVRALAASIPLSFGLGHSFTELRMGTDPTAEDVSLARPVYETFWLNVFGPHMVERIGRQRLLSTPCYLMEELPHGAFLCLTRPTPADFDSEEARLAQARALVHLRPELNLDSTLATLRQRSLVFSPIPIQFHPDVAEIIMWEVDFRGLQDKRQNVELFNRYRPPPVSEWIPASQAPAPDVADVKKRINSYRNLWAEQLIALFHKDVPAVLDGTLEALPRLDWRLWHFRWGKDITRAQKVELITLLGAWLGHYLVKMLGGQWVPRENFMESAVIIGDRAWLPFLRAAHALNGLDAPLDYSCTQFFREAQRFAQQQAH
ncbi:MAG: hypothetical protein ACJ8AT_02490 [Hyalangium sp.]|uniref:hypothetical protein n=1 Tax=Hyalangium sp. TaxID=2028555 RepID=UPI00389A9B87